MRRKIFLYIKCVVLNGIRNPVRFILSITGVFVGVLLLSYSVFFLDSYYNGSMEKVEKMPDDSFIVSGLDGEMLKEINGNVKGSFPQQIKYTGDGNYLLYDCEYSGKYIYYYSTVVGTPGQENVSVYFDNGSPHLTSLSLLQGRLISNKDVSDMNRVVVIDDYTAKLLFPGTDPIGQSLSIQEDSVIYRYQIVGVVSANDYVKNAFSNMNSLLKGNEGAIFVNTCVYIPGSVWEEDFKDESNDAGSLLLWTGLDGETKKQYQTEIKNYFSTSYDNNITDKTTDRNIVLEELSIYKNLFMLFFAVVFIFSALNCMNISFFSVKERVSEIGIRKAYGASKENIVIQFMLESIIVSIIATIFAVLVALILMIKTLPIVSDYLGLNLVVKIKAELIILPFLAAIFQGIISSIIPSIYASSIKVVDALRFE